MQSPTIIYYGVSGLQSEVLATYFTNLGVSFRPVPTRDALERATTSAPCPLVVLADNTPPSEAMRIARGLIPDPSSAFPHVFILTDAEPFDAQLEAITIIAGPSKLRRLAEQLRAFLHAPS